MALIFRDAAGKRPLCTIPSMLQAAAPIRSRFTLPLIRSIAARYFFPKRLTCNRYATRIKPQYFRNTPMLLFIQNFSTRVFFESGE